MIIKTKKVYIPTKCYVPNVVWTKDNNATDIKVILGMITHIKDLKEASKVCQ